MVAMASLPSALRKAYRRREVALIVGAGISQGCKHFGWRELAREVVASVPRPSRPPIGSVAASQRVGRTPPHDPGFLHPFKQRFIADENELVAMRHIRHDKSLNLAELVQRVLYSRDHPLSEAAQLIPALTRVKKICCYNYDDVLERAFTEAGVRHLSLFQNQPIPFEDKRVLILYPHGYLPDPSQPTLSATSDIVLSEDDYFALYGAPYAWANLVQMTLLQNYTAIFVGCSLTDPNVRRLLHATSAVRPEHRHFAVLKPPDPSSRLPKWMIKNDHAAYRSVKKQELDSLGVVPLWVSTHNEIDDVLRTLADNA